MSDAYGVMEDEVYELREQLKVARSEAVFHRYAVKELEAAALREREKVAGLVEATKKWIKVTKPYEDDWSERRDVGIALAAFDAPPEGGKP